MFLAGEKWLKMDDELDDMLPPPGIDAGTTRKGTVPDPFLVLSLFLSSVEEISSGVCWKEKLSTYSKKTFFLEWHPPLHTHAHTYTHRERG